MYACIPSWLSTEFRGVTPPLASCATLASRACLSVRTHNEPRTRSDVRHNRLGFGEKVTGMGTTADACDEVTPQITSPLPLIRFGCHIRALSRHHLPKVRQRAADSPRPSWLPSPLRAFPGWQEAGLAAADEDPRYSKDPALAPLLRRRRTALPTWIPKSPGCTSTG